MKAYFMTLPEIYFQCECYHYKDNNKPGNKGDRIITYNETYRMPYYSERDVSGLFYLNCDKAKRNKKKYIKLELSEEIKFADAISYMDYEKEKDSFWRRNRFRDAFFDFKEIRIIPGIPKNIMVKITDDDTCTVNFFFYLILSFLTLAEFYKLYIYAHLCVKQKYTIKKLVSTRYDLNQPVYQTFAPQINLITQTLDYESQDYNYKNTSYQVQMPTEEELEKAKEYQSKVPSYEISNDNNIKVGVVVDYPESNKEKNNYIPPAFISVPGDVPLAPNQINPNGDLPPGFDEFRPQIQIQNYEKTPQSLLPIQQQDRQGDENSTNYQLGYQPPNT